MIYSESEELFDSLPLEKIEDRLVGIEDTRLGSGPSTQYLVFAWRQGDVAKAAFKTE
jgi:hypothetical protein